MPSIERPRVRSPRLSPVRRLALSSVALVVGLTFLQGWLWNNPQAPAAWVAFWFLAATAVTFLAYGVDKRQARVNGRRIPERVLHFLAAIGGTLGALAGMRVFRHKTLKGPFQNVFWALTAAQVLLLVGFTYWSFR